jgi:hypothetical protein
MKEYLVKGYAFNQNKLVAHSRQLEEFKQTVKLLGQVMKNQELSSEEAIGLLKVLTDYAYALDILDKYDHQILEIDSSTSKELFQITYPEAMKAIRHSAAKTYIQVQRKRRQACYIL